MNQEFSNIQRIPQSKNQPRILVGLSGGVDSAVSAYLLKEAGYEVACGFMINYLEDDSPQPPSLRGVPERQGECSTLADLEEAKKVAVFLDLPLYTFDYREEYEKRIVEYIYREYEAGRTPNPDVFCNNLVKFDLFLEEALALGYDAIATGHYARTTSSPSLLLKEKGVHETIQKENSHSLKERGLGDEVLLKGLDPNKDQSYFLSRLTPFQLSKAMLPIGHLMKSEVREIAKKAGLPNADRKDSQGLCFIGKVSMKEFLERRIAKKPGNILDTSGKVIGEHEGAYSYTIGQRRGIMVGGGPALFVIAKDVKNNTITVGSESELELYSKACTLTDWIGDTPEPGKKYGAKIRYRQEDQEVLVNGACHSECSEESAQGFKVLRNRSFVPQDDKNTEKSTAYHILFTTPQRAIASGQICVIYEGDRVVGSGIIV